ncbi:MAG: phosphodiester glycosidase family protein [Limnothrix sp.]
MDKAWQRFMAGGLLLWGLGCWLPESVFLMKNSASAIAAESDNLTSHGNRVRLNGQTLRGNWATWSENGKTHLGVESMGLEKSLGIQLLDTRDSLTQPVAWFEGSGVLPVKFANPYRYVDVTELATGQGWQWRGQGEVLELQTPTAKILNIRQGRQAWGERIVMDLDRPILWRQATPTTVTLQGNLASFLTPLLDEKTEKAPEQQPSALPFTVRSQGSETTLTFSTAIAPQIQVSTLTDPPRLIIDLRRDYRPSRTVEWLPGMTWRQQNVVLPGKNNGGFGVTWVELDPTRSNLKLAPFAPSDQTIVGLAPMITQAETNGAIAAINAGFFNRNNYYPLGAIREDNVWRSSPILNRGAVGWDDQGNWEFERLSMRETLVAQNGEVLSIELLNSGYVKAGAARYTKAWGDRYTTLIDDEVVLAVSNGQVVAEYAAQKAGADSYAIPADGYLLAFRSFRSGAAKFPVGTRFNLENTVFPENFNNLPQIMGAGPLLVQNNRIVLDGEAEQFSKAFNYQSASRSAIARTRDNKIMLATVHGTALESSGATLREWSDILLRLGATDALNLDGGGSSALVVGGDLGDRHSSTAGRVNNAIGVFLDQP